jgi:hypothetical protein
MREGVGSLRNPIRKLQRSMQDTRIDASTRALLSSEIKRAEKVVAAFEKALGETGS